MWRCVPILPTWCATELTGLPSQRPLLATLIRTAARAASQPSLSFTTCPPNPVTHPTTHLEQHLCGAVRLSRLSVDPEQQVEVVQVQAT